MDYKINKKIEALDNNVSIKRKALTTHLIKSQARRNDYKIVKGHKVIVNNKNVTKVSGGNLKAVGKNFENFAKTALVSDDDIGMKPVFMAIDGARAVVTGTKKLNAISRKVVEGTAKVTKGTIIIAGKSYRVAGGIYAGYKTGTLKGTLNMYKKLAVHQAATTIKYSKPVYDIKNLGDGAKRIWLKADYKISKGITFIKGVKNKQIKVTKRMVGTFVGRGTKTTVKGVVKGVGRVYKSKITRGTIRGVGGAVKSIGSLGNDEAVQSALTTAEMVHTSYKMSKATVNGAGKVGRGVDKTIKGTKTVGKGVYVTARGVIRFGQGVRKEGFKKASKTWYKAHLKGAGKTVKEKASEAIRKMVTSIVKNPVVLAGIALVLGLVIIISTTTIIASSTVGGVIEFFEDLAEGLIEIVDTVVEAIGDFLESCIDWLGSLFGIGDDDEIVIEVDVDIGDSMSICDYLLGTVQLYKAKYGLEIAERVEELKDEGYHSVIFYNYYDKDEPYIQNYNEVTKGLMPDKEYVMCELPVWKAIVLGKIGTDFTAEQANATAELCFNALTKKEEEPYVDLDGDGEADYSYCDGSTSMNEGENKVVVQIGGEWLGGLECSESQHCYNLSSELYHDSHNTDGITCCSTEFRCGGHMRYMCDGHKIYCWEQYSDSAGSCTNCIKEIHYCTDEQMDSCVNKVATTVNCWTGYINNKTDYNCNNYTTIEVAGETCYICKGHDVVYCNESENEWELNCDNHSLHNNVKCFEGNKYSTEPPCDNCTQITYITNGIYVYQCNGHDAEKCDGHTPYKCEGHEKFICRGHSTLCWEGWVDNPGTCTDYRTWEELCYIGSRTESQGCTNEYSEFSCKGYTLCKGHKIMKFNIGSPSNDALKILLDTTMGNRIAELEGKSDLTQEERNELSQLKMQYEYALSEATRNDPVAKEWYENQP